MKHYLYIACAIICGGLFVAAVPFSNLLEKLPDTVNTDKYDEINAVEDPRNGELYFTRVGSPEFRKTLMEEGSDVSKQMSGEEFNEYLSNLYEKLGAEHTDPSYSSAFNQDIWKVNEDYSSDSSTKHLPYPANNALPNSIVGYLKNPFRWVVINQFYADGGMRPGLSSVKVNKDGSYDFPEPMHIYGFHTKSNDLTAAIKNDGEVIILSLDRPDAVGQTDLYVSFKVKENVWGTPQRIGDQINTFYEETSPFIGPDGKTLYFASDRPGGAGGLDIYVSKRKDYSWKSWSEPQRLARPLNSGSDDLQPSLSSDFRHLYITSTRDGTADIYRYDLHRNPDLKPELLSIKGKVINLHTGKKMNGAKVFYGPADDVSETRNFEAENGSFVFNVPENESFVFFPQKKGYVSRTYIHKPDKTFSNNTKKLTLYLLPKGKFAEEDYFKKDRIQLDKIYFKQSEATIKKNSYMELEKLLYVMQMNPDLKIQIEGHTDNQGPIDALMNLSRNRANAVKQHLVDEGVEAHRIQTKGFGPARPITDNSSEKKRRENRRVEFVILSQ